jgi:hypothetical protein
VAIHEAAFDGLGRRVVKTVSNSGDLDGVTAYYHNRNQIIETRDGSGNLETQVYHGTQYIDEVVGQRIANMSRVYVHQDANYNVTGATDLTARQIERNYYSPYWRSDWRSGQSPIFLPPFPSFPRTRESRIGQEDFTGLSTA